MKFSDDSNLAAKYLRLAVPKMVQHKIVPNPLNYALWYSYFSNVSKDLNTALDSTIERFGTCPQVVSEALFLSHLSDTDKLDQVEGFQDSLMNLASGLSDSIEATTLDTGTHSNELKKNLLELNSSLETSDEPSVIKQLATSVQAICESNDKFQRQIDLALSEIATLKSELENSKLEATTDHLTGLFNRRVLGSMYQDLSMKSADIDIALIMIDIDHFKKFNDTFGHNMGDQVLKFVGKLLLNECKSPCIPVRLGGEEFTILCPSYSVKQAEKLAEVIRRKLASAPLVNGKTNEKIPPITASFGVALAGPNDILTTVLERADMALYSAKSNGRNRVEVADSMAQLN
ncbi:MAG: GGDEF domain-containing protein [Gammaproteobacteria bacterium]|nr:GGDEF domain-containing protein [Gammaproteobacteria bacterium]